jgi:type III pantothenate kinase
MIERVILALNVGNTHLGYGFVEDGEITSTGRTPTPPADRAFEVEMIIDEALGRSSDSGENVEIVVASVVPAVTEALRDIAARRHFRLLEADETTVPFSEPSGIETGAGHDRLVNAFAAARLHGTPAIVVDLGTATTFDVVGATERFLGGAIAPGVGLGIDALTTRTAQLPRVPLALPSTAIGTNTLEAIQSGTVLGHVGMVEYLLAAITASLPGDSPSPKVILTGGLAAHPWAATIHGVTAIDPLLTLRGLALLHAHHARRATVPAG